MCCFSLSLLLYAVAVGSDSKAFFAVHISYTFSNVSGVFHSQWGEVASSSFEPVVSSHTVH